MATTANTGGHIRKRQFQPSITSFFGQRDPNTNELSPRSTSPLSPPLPADTQASLLSVGMRVRKSVPEGYKTHKTLEAQGFPFPSSAPAATTPTRSSGSSASTRELTPFCGLHKIGGWAAQEGFTSSAPAVMDSDDDDIPGMTMSQATLSSTQGSFRGVSQSQQLGASRKRGYDEEVEEDLDAYFNDIDAADMEDEQQTRISDRPIARMRGTKAVARGGGEAVGVADDFEEASFLSPAEGMDVDLQ